MKQGSRAGLGVRSGLLPAVLVVAACGLAAPLQAEEFYKWVDADGVTHYTRNPPPDQSQTHVINTRNQVIQTVKPEMPAAASAPEEAADAAGDQQAAVDPAEARALMQAQCQAARANVENLEPSTRVLTTNEDGETIRMDDNERLRLLQEARDFVEQNC